MSETSRDQAQELLFYTNNKYELVLTVAKKAKRIREDIHTTPESQKPIRMALKELAKSEREARENVF
jgi:DNA-directed RNA polymerase subunit K/omega